MKILFNFENGMELSVGPENLALVPNGSQGSAIVTKTDTAVVPLIFFKVQLATTEELKARDEKAKEAAVAADAQQQPAAQAVVAPPAA